MTDDEKSFFSAFSVSYETIHRLTLYKKSLIQWNEKINLVAKSTLETIYSRHFLDSAQLMPFIPDTASILADIGAGAGFPGLVLAILAKEKALPLEIHEIESTGKKADFLQSVVDELGLNVVVRRERAEDIRDLKADVVTARAVKALPELLRYAKTLMKNDSVGLFLKGKSLSEELTEAKKYWTFDPEIHQSQSDASGQIVVIKNLRRKH
ncbi:MAG: 16S rRNA (guanine(527)-N(7))-methyltransferase RsmG [Alphaproteobacteria bacterium]|nr:16S rRNA (guanine(527)-N(7))-methyltransferase RsmG [Alphaproteobacteria bacterium]